MNDLYIFPGAEKPLYCDIFKITDNPLHVFSSCGYEAIFKYLNDIMTILERPLLVVLPIIIIYLIYSLVTKKDKRLIKVVIILHATYMTYKILTSVMLYI